MSGDSEPLVYKCMLITDGQVAIMDVIKHDGRNWLVPNWYENKDEGWRTPERIVLLDFLPHEHLPQNQAWQFLVGDPQPKELFFGDDPSKAGKHFVVHLMPGFRIPLAAKLN